MRLSLIISGLALGLSIKAGALFFISQNSESQALDLRTALQKDSKSPESLGFAFSQLLKQPQTNKQVSLPEQENTSPLRIPSSVGLLPDWVAIAELGDTPDLLIKEASRQLNRLRADDFPARLQLILEVHALSHEGFNVEALEFIFNEVNWISTQALPNNEETLHHFSNLIRLAKSLGSSKDVEYVTNTLMEKSLH